MKNFILIMIGFLCLNTSCGYFIGEKHVVKFECNKAGTKSIQPPEGTFKCTIESVKNGCNLNSEIFILYNNHTKLDLNDSGILFCQDWYDSMLLSLEYVPSVEDSLNRNTKTIELLVTFNY